MRGNAVGGIRSLVEGAKILTHPSLRLFVIVPLTVNIIIFATLITLGGLCSCDVVPSRPLPPEERTSSRSENGAVQEAGQPAHGRQHRTP